MLLNLKDIHDLLDEFNFVDLFINNLGWNSCKNIDFSLTIENKNYKYQQIAEISGAAVFEVVAIDSPFPDAKIRKQIHSHITKYSKENLLIFLDKQRKNLEKPTRSLWYWVKTEDKKSDIVREHLYERGQSGDSLLGKIASLFIDISQLENGEISILKVAQQLKEAFNIEKVTREFYEEFKKVRLDFMTHIEIVKKNTEDKHLRLRNLIHKGNDKSWYTSVILNRLMFVYFLQKKLFINNDESYLKNKLKESKDRGENLFYKDFLNKLFFESFAKPESERDGSIKEIVGDIKYLNGGLFLEHFIEQNYDITIKDEAFELVIDFFARYSWNLDDRYGENDKRINPAVLGHIFEKHTNQKASGAYYTKREITEYLCEKTISKLIVDRVNSQLTPKYKPFDNINDLLTSLDKFLCRLLIDIDDKGNDKGILNNLSILDPACGSGAFLVAAIENLSQVYRNVQIAIEWEGDSRLKEWLKQQKASHPSLEYFFKKRIITNNLYGVDIIEEATEIARLRLFLDLVASVDNVSQLKPLPNIDFNIMTGNSLIGLIKVDETGFDAVELTRKAKRRGIKQEVADLQMSLLPMDTAYRYNEILKNKNQLIQHYKHLPFQSVEQYEIFEKRPLTLRKEIENLHEESQYKLNKLLFNEFNKLRIKYENFQIIGKSKKDDLQESHIDNLKPFHWGYHFDKVLEKGGFDVIITNPPWEIFKPQAKEFFAQYDELVTKNKMDIKVFEKEQKRLLQNPEVADAWLEYQCQYPYVSAYFRSAEQYKNQISVVDGKKAGTDINLYKLFLEQCFNLLRQNGECGIVIPSGINTDLGAKQLREMLFNQTKVTGLFCLENRKEVFEGVHRSSKIVVLTFAKGGKTTEFPSAFMRHDVQELQRFPSNDSFLITVDMLRKLSPDSLSVMEFKNHIEYNIAKKVAKHFQLNNIKSGFEHIKLTRELAPNSKSKSFHTFPGIDLSPLLEGKMIHQFSHKFSTIPRYWISESDARGIILGKIEDKGQTLDYQTYRLGFRKIASSTNEHTMIATVIPPSLCIENLQTVRTFDKKGNQVVSYKELLYLCAIWNSFIYESLLRLKVSANINFHFIYGTQVPRLTENDRSFNEIVQRAAKLICTTPEFDELAQEVGLESHTNGVNDESERAKLRAELDGMIAHIYGLTEEEFAYILTTFPSVQQQVKEDALAAYRDFAPLTGDAEIIEIITTQDESSTLEFKSTARWDIEKNQKNLVMEDVILKTVASFLNTSGGTLLIGVTDEKEIIGLDLDYQTFSKPNKRDAYQLFLMNDLLLRQFGKDLAPFIDITFHEVERRDVCRITAKLSPRPVFIEVNTKNKKQKCLFVRSGNSTIKLTANEEIENYCKSRWQEI